VTAAVAALVLELIQGSTKPFDVYIFDENEVAEDLSSADRAIVEIRKSMGGDVVLSRDSSAGNVTIGTGKLTCTLLAYEAAALDTGDFIGAAKVRFSDDDAWQDTDPFIVRVLPGVPAPILFLEGNGIPSEEAFGTPTIVQS